MGNHEASKILNVAAGDYPFELTLGGYYAVTAHSTWGGGSNHLQLLLPDGTSYADVGSSTNFTADGVVIAVVLPPGQYRWHITTATANYAVIARCPVN